MPQMNESETGTCNWLNLESMIGKNRRLVTDEPVEVQDFRKLTDHFIGIYRICLK